jgi:hypothetical protein
MGEIHKNLIGQPASADCPIFFYFSSIFPSRKSNALSLRKQCFCNPKAMLFEGKSSDLGGQKQ